MTRIVATGAHAEHRSMPQGGWWWGPADVHHDRVVVIVRDRDATLASAVAAGHVRNLADSKQRWEHAMQALRTLDAAWIRYERLVHDPYDTVNGLARQLGVTLTIPEPIRNENPKWRR